MMLRYDLTCDSAAAGLPQLTGNPMETLILFWCETGVRLASGRDVDNLIPGWLPERAEKD